MPLVVLILVALGAGLGAARLAWALRARPPMALARAIAIAGGAIVAILTVLVGTTDVVSGLDRSVADWAYGHATPFTHTWLSRITDLGEVWAIAIVGVVVVLVDFARRRSPWALPFILLVIAGDKVLTQALKHIVDRARPTLEPIAATLGPSFPSGHSSTAAASWAALALVASCWWVPRARPALVGAAVGVAVGVALSRVFLDVHWLTDVIGGLALGWAWFALCGMAFGGLLCRPSRQS